MLNRWASELDLAMACTPQSAQWDAYSQCLLDCTCGVSHSVVDGYPETPTSDVCHRSRFSYTCWQGCGWTGRYRRASIVSLRAACAIVTHFYAARSALSTCLGDLNYMDYCRERFVMKLDLPIAGAVFLL